jgi:hypothetical protein
MAFSAYLKAGFLNNFEFIIFGMSKTFHILVIKMYNHSIFLLLNPGNNHITSLHERYVEKSVNLSSEQSR